LFSPFFRCRGDLCALGGRKSGFGGVFDPFCARFFFTHAFLYISIFHKYSQEFLLIQEKKIFEASHYSRKKNVILSESEGSSRLSPGKILRPPASE